MKLFSIISAILTVLFAAMLLEGILTSLDSIETAHINIEAPQRVIYNTLQDVSNYELWNTLSSGKDFSEQNLIRKAIYKIGPKNISVNEKLTILPDENTFQFNQIDSLPGSFITNIRNSIILKGQSDGTSEVSWQISYSVSNITANLINRLYIKPALKKALSKNLISLKKHIEH